MKARDLASLNGRLAIALKRARADGVGGSDEDVTDAILIKNGAGDIDLRALLTRLRRSTARQVKPGEQVRTGFT